MEKRTVEEVIELSKNAQEIFSTVTQEQADGAAKAICKVIFDNAKMLGEMAATETKMGKLEDKITKCYAKSSLIWESLKDKKSVGVIRKDEDKKIIEIAKPMGVVASILPSTNPVVTPMSNGAFALKTRNSIIFAPHPRAINLTDVVVKLFREELEKLGLPADLVLCLEENSIEESGKLMQMADVVVATGGMGMVKAAYSSGKPAYGVGAGNVQSIVDEDCDLEKAAKDILLGRKFDNGLICLGEQMVFVPENKYDEFIEKLEENYAFYIDDANTVQKVRETLFPDNGPINKDVVGKSAVEVSEILGIKVPENTEVIVVKAGGIAEEDVLCKEKICPVLSIYPYKTFEEGVEMMVSNLNFEGKGHSISIHSNSDDRILYAAEKCSVSRVIVNQPSGTTGGGSPTNGFIPTTTLGCGSWGNNSFSGNFNYEHLMNITRVGYALDESYLPKPELAWE